MSSNASRDQNRIPTLLCVSNVDYVTPVKVAADPVTHRLLTDSAAISLSLQTDAFTSTNGQTTFTATKNIAFMIYVSVNGSIQRPSTDYTISGSNVVLTSGIPSGNDVILTYATS